MPAPRNEHELLENDVADAVRGSIQSKFGGSLDRHGVDFTLDSFMARSWKGFDDSLRRRADFYLWPNDGRGIVVGEVGECRSDKWKNVFAEDGLPIRVLRVGFDRSVGMMNPRFSRREVFIVRAIQDLLWNFK